MLNIRSNSYNIMRLSPWSINIITTFINFLSILAYLIADLTTCQPNFKLQIRYLTNINSWPQYKMQQYIWLILIWIVHTDKPWYYMEDQLLMVNFETLVLNKILQKIFKSTEWSIKWDLDCAFNISKHNTIVGNNLFEYH